MQVHALSLLVLLALPAFADAAQEQPVPTTYLAALEQGLSSRLEVRMDRASGDMAAARVDEAKGAFLPTLTAHSTVQRIRVYNDFSPISISFNYAGEKIPVAVTNAMPPYEVGVGLDVRYNLYAGGADRARLDAANASRRAAEAGAQLTRRQVVEEVTRAYWNVVKARVEARRIARALALATSEAQITRVAYQQGKLAQVEAEVKELAVQVQQTEWQSSQRILADLIRRYLLAIGMNATPEAVQALQTARELEQEQGLNALNPAELLAQLQLSASPQVDRERAQLDGARAAVAEARAEYKPTLDFFIRYNSIGRSVTGFDNAVSQYGRDAAYVGLQLSWKLFDGFRSDSRIRHALAAAEKQRAMVELAQREARDAWQDRASHVSDLDDKLALAQQQLALEEAQLKVARMRMETKLGSATQTQAVANAVEDARDRMTVLKIDAFVARIEAFLARAQ